MLDPDRKDGEPLPTKDSENLDKAFGPDGHSVSCGGLINRAAGWEEVGPLVWHTIGSFESNASRKIPHV